MPLGVTSKHLVGATELTVIMPIKQGLIDTRDTVTYATRLRFVLRVLNIIRKKAREVIGASEYVGPVERLRTINFIRFAIFNNDSQLLLAVSFDRPWEPYIRTIRNDAGPILDAILCHCDGYTGVFDSSKGYDKFSEWIRKYQIDVDFFYASEPELTTDDLRYLKEFEARQRRNANPDKFDKYAPSLRVGDPAAKAGIGDVGRTKKNALIRQGLRALKALYRLKKYFPEGVKGTTDTENLNLEYDYWLTTAQSILQDFDSKALIPEKSRFGIQYKSELSWLQSKPMPHKVNPIPRSVNKKNVQGNVLSAYEDMTHGCMLLLQFPGRAKAREFLVRIKPLVTMEEPRPNRNKARINLALTRQGLENIGLTPTQMAEFPKEFLEGMEQRAGLLGDIRCNHPDFWNLPDWNWPVENRAITVRLATVDVVVQIQISKFDFTGKSYLFKPEKGFYFFDKKHPLYKDVMNVINDEKDITLLSVQPLRRKYKDTKLDVVVSGKTVKKRFVEEHFGFADGISQPDPTESPSSRDQVSMGELLIGYYDDRDPTDKRQTKKREGEILENLFKDSTFLVVRKLRQYVGRLNDLLDYQHNEDGTPVDLLKAKIVGREPSGRSLMPGSDIQDFDYKDDADGLVCPFQSHVRRTNPRPEPDQSISNISIRWANVRWTIPRIMRRGFSYGPRYSEVPDDEVDRGLVFMAYIANIAEQFEVVQRWVSGGNSTGILSTLSDPLLGVPLPRGEDRTFRFRNGDEVVRCDLGSKPFVELQWGMYLFVPSGKAIAELINWKVKSDQAKRGLKIITELLRLERLEHFDAELAKDKWTSVDRWISVLEDKSAKIDGVTSAVWSAIREEFGGALLTSYGLLLGSHEKVLDALRNPTPYSVREYWFRMKKSFGEGFLGMDPDPAALNEDGYTKQVKKGDYANAANKVNSIVSSFSKAQGYALGREEMGEALKALPDPGVADLNEIGVGVFMRICKQLFGVPTAEQRPLSVLNFTYAGRYTFSSPHPSAFLIREGRKRGKAELKDAEVLVKTGRADATNIRGEISKELFNLYPDTTEGNLTLSKTIAGLSNGLIAPTLGSFLSVVYGLTKTENLWRVQQALLKTYPKKSEREKYANVKNVVEGPVVSAMRALPVPDIVYRTLTKPVTVKNNVTVPAGTTVILGIDSAAKEIDPLSAETDVLFGGNYNPPVSHKTPPPPHACSGAELGIGVVVGMVTALLEAGRLAPENAPLVLSINKSTKYDLY